MPYRYNINYGLSQDKNSELLLDLKSDNLVRLYLATIYLTISVAMFCVG